jgi:hypothetical protein
VADERGEFTVPGLVPGDYRIFAKWSDQVSATSQFSVGETGETPAVELRLGKGGVICVKPCATASADTLRLVDAFGEVVPLVVLNGNPSRTTPVLPPGTYDLVFTPANGSESHRAVEVRAGESTVVELP